MSYAAVAAHNAPPPSEQPHPDPALLNVPNLATAPPPAADDASKVNVVASDFKEHPATLTSEYVNSFPPPSPSPSGPPAPRKRRARKTFDDAEAEGLYLWEKLKDVLFRPPVAGGLLGVVNLGLLAGTAYAFYTDSRLRRDAGIITSTAVGGLAIIGAEGYAAESFLQTEAGQEAAHAAKEEGSAVYRYSREHVLRPGVLGGFVGLVNVGVLGTLGYFAYSNWDRPHWDRRTVSSISAGLLALWGGEGYLATRRDVQRQFK